MTIKLKQFLNSGVREKQYCKINEKKNDHGYKFKFKYICGTGEVTNCF